MDPRAKHSVETGQLVIVDNEGRQWFSGAASAALSTETYGQNSRSADATEARKGLEQALPPTVFSALRANSRANVRKPAKVRASARQDAPPIHPIFMKASDETEDPFWKEILKRMSRGVYRKGFRYIPAVSSSSGLANTAPAPAVLPEDAVVGKLTFRSKTREFECPIVNSPAAVLEAAKEFMHANSGLTSEMDQAALSTQLSEIVKKSVHFSTPQTWSDIKTAGSRTSLITHFALRLKEQYGLSKSQTKDLVHTINLSVASGHFASDHIVLRHGAIESIRGLRRDENTGEFYVELDSVAPHSRRGSISSERLRVLTESAASSRVADDAEDGDDPLADANSEAPTVTRAKRRTVVANPRPTDEFIAAFATLRRARSNPSQSADAGTADAPAAVPESGPVPPGAPASTAIFTGTVDSVESLFSSESAKERVIRPVVEGPPQAVSTAFPSKADIDSYAESYKGRFDQIVLAPISAAAYGFAASKGSDAKVHALKYARGVLDGGLRGLVGIPEAHKALLEAAVFENDLERVKDSIQSLPEKLTPEHFDDSVFSARRTETLAMAAIQKAQRNRMEILASVAKSAAQNSKSPLNETLSAAHLACRPRATLRRWSKYVEDLTTTHGHADRGQVARAPPGAAAVTDLDAD